jgi:hypothetical protein
MTETGPQPPLSTYLALFSQIWRIWKLVRTANMLRTQPRDFRVRGFLLHPLRQVWLARLDRPLSLRSDVPLAT